MLAPMLLSVLLGQSPDGTVWKDRHDRLGDLLPPGAVARFGNTRFRHGAEILELAVSPTGKFVVTRAKDDPDAKLWDAVTGRQLARCSFKDAGVNRTAFLSDTTVAFLAETVVLWTAGREAEKLMPELVPENVSAAAASADGKTWAVGGEKAIHILDAGSPREVKQTLATAAPPLGLAFSPDGKWLAAENLNSVSLWSRATGKRVRSFAIAEKPAVRFNAASDRLYCWNATTIRLLALDSDEDDPAFEPQVIEGGGLVDLALSGDGQSLVVLHAGGRVHRLDAKTGKELGKPIPAPNGVLVTPFARLTRDGKRVVARWEDQRWASWDAATGRAEPTEPLPQLLDLRLSADGKTAVCQAEGDVFRAWDVADGKPRDDLRPRGKEAPGGAAWNATGERVVFENDRKEVVCLRVKDGQLLATVPAATEASKFVAFVVGDPKRIARFLPNSVELVDLDGQRPTRSFPYLANDWGVAVVSPDGRSLVLGGKKEDTAVFELKTGQLRLSVKVRAAQVKFAPDGRTLGIGDDGGFLTILDAVSGRETRKLSMAGSGFTFFDFSPDGKRAVTACRGSNRLIEVWDIEAAQVVCELPGHATGSVSAVAFAPDGRHVVTCGTDGCAYVWDTRYRKPPDSLRRHFDFATPPAAREALGSHDAEMAFQAVAFLIERPAEAVAELRKAIPTATGPTAEELTRAVAKLASKEFAERDAGRKALVAAGAAAEAALRTEVKAPATPESGRITGELLAKLERGYSTPTDLQAARAVEVLERVGTPDAKKLLSEWAAGAPLGTLTAEAKAALARMK